MKSFLLVGLLLAFFVTLTGLMPSEFFVVAQDIDAPTIPEGKFTGLDLGSYARTYGVPMDGSDNNGTLTVLEIQDSYAVEMDIGGHDCRFVYTKPNYSNLECHFVHYFAKYWGLDFLWGGSYHLMKWTSETGYDREYHLLVEELEVDYDDGLPYTLSCSHFHWEASFYYNTTAYATVEDAWNMGALEFAGGIEFDQMSTSLNAFNLIGMLIVFQAPFVHPYLNYIIAIPIWLCIAYLATGIVIAIIRAFPLT